MATWMRFSLAHEKINFQDISSSYITNGSIGTGLYYHLSSVTYSRWVYPVYHEEPAFSSSVGYNTSGCQDLCVAHSSYESTAAGVVSSSGAAMSVDSANKMPANGVPLYYIHDLSADGYLLLKVTEFYESGSSSVQIYNAQALSYTHLVRGTWIDLVTASVGTYPDDGIQGNYWYVLSSSPNETAFANVGGTLYEAKPYVNVSGTIYEATMYVNVGGTIYETSA